MAPVAIATASPLHVVLLAIGSLGDAGPLHLIARALHRRGHAVTLVALPGFQTAAEDEFEVVTAPQDLAPELAESQGAARWFTKTWVGRGLSSWRASVPLTLRRARWVYGFLQERHQRGKTVVLARSGLFGARIAREGMELRLISVHHTPAPLRSRYESFVLPVPEGEYGALRLARGLLWRCMDGYVGTLLLPSLNTFRRELKLPPIRRLFDRWAFSPDMNMALFPEWYASPQPDWPAHTHLAGFPLSDEQPLHELSEEVQAFLGCGGPVIVFTRGSHSASGAEFFRMARDVCWARGWRGLILGLAPESVAEFHNPAVLQVRFAPLAAVLRRASLLVHHGGIGTCALAFRAGVPQIMIPGIGDQWDQAKRVARLGCGIYLSMRSLNRARLASAQMSLLHSDEARARCVRVAEMVRADGISRACSLVELAGRPPVGAA